MLNVRHYHHGKVAMVKFTGRASTLAFIQVSFSEMEWTVRNGPGSDFSSWAFNRFTVSFQAAGQCASAFAWVIITWNKRFLCVAELSNAAFKLLYILLELIRGVLQKVSKCMHLIHYSWLRRKSFYYLCLI